MSGGGDDLPHRLSDERSQRDMANVSILDFIGAKGDGAGGDN